MTITTNGSADGKRETEINNRATGAGDIDWQHHAVRRN
jgi:hypothetical protein